MNNEPAMGPEALARRRKGRLMMLAIVAVFVLPFFVLPLLMSPETMNKTNRGVLVNPHVNFAQLHAGNISGEMVQAPPQKKWFLLYVLPNPCDQSCAIARNNSLFVMRQLPPTLGRDLVRVKQLVLLTTEPSAEVNNILQKEFSDVEQLRVDAGIIDSVLAPALSGAAASSAGNIYLMSPDGYIFIYYPPETDEQGSMRQAEDIRSDLKKSLKGSRI